MFDNYLFIKANLLFMLFDKSSKEVVSSISFRSSLMCLNLKWTEQGIISEQLSNPKPQFL